MGKTSCRRKPSEAERKAWPRLSDIPGPCRPDCCQNCDAQAGQVGRNGQIGLTFWQEHDHEDKPLPVVVTLCRSCANALIAPHPRLYRQLGEHEPWPGLMTICGECRFRRGIVCTHAKARDRTLQITQQPPAHLSIGPRRRSQWLWFKPATDCEGMHKEGL